MKITIVAPDKQFCSKGHLFTEQNEKIASLSNQYGEYLVRVCKTCHREDSRHRRQALAAKRAARTTRKGEKPSRDELEGFLKVGSTWTSLGLRYGVSDVAVRKWAKAYGLLAQTTTAR